MYPRPEELQVEIQRVDNNAEMFHRIEVQKRDQSREDRPRGQGEIIGCLNQKDLIGKLKTTKTMNLLTFVAIIVFLPQTILGICYHECDQTSGGCEVNTLFIWLQNYL